MTAENKLEQQKNAIDYSNIITDANVKEVATALEGLENQMIAFEYGKPITSPDGTVIEHKEGATVNFTTLVEMAGVSEVSGRSLLAYKNIEEWLGDDVFDDTGYLSPKWKTKLVNEYKVPENDVNNAKRENIADPGPVRDRFGLLLRDAYGASTIGKDTQASETYESVNTLKLPYTFQRVQGMIDKKSIPDDLPADLKTEVKRLIDAKLNATNGRFPISLNTAFADAVVNGSISIYKIPLVTVKTSEVSAERDAKLDLQGYPDLRGSKDFSTAFRIAAGTNFWYDKGDGIKLYSGLRGSQAPELVGKPYLDSTKNSKSNPDEQKSREQSVVNPKAELTSINK